MRKQIYSVEVIVEDGATDDADDLRQSILDAWGFPNLIEEEPHRLVVKLIETVAIEK